MRRSLAEKLLSKQEAERLAEVKRAAGAILHFRVAGWQAAERKLEAAIIAARRHGYTRAEVARIVDVSPSVIEKIEKGER